MSTLAVKNLATEATKFKSACRKLAQHGSAALLPRCIEDTEANKRIYQSPLISRRVANVLRKQAIREGTFGSFNVSTGVGWDPQWDADLALAKTQGHGRFRIQPPKKAKRERTREARALKIEEKMEGMDQRMEELWVARQANKPAKTFQNRYKEMMRGKK